MTVVPGSTELSSKECVGSGLARRNRTLSKTTNTISTDAVELSDTMPMETAAIVLERVLDVDNDSVSPVGCNDWPRHLVVDKVALNEPVAVWVTCCVCDFKVVVDGVSCGRMFQVKVRLDTVSIAPT
jgi:hypothetical protein